MKPTITTIIGFFITAFTIYFTHRLATLRDRRKEYNILAEKNLLALEKERQFIINHKALYGKQESIDFNRFISKLSMFKRRRFNGLLKEYYINLAIK